MGKDADVSESFYVNPRAKLAQNAKAQHLKAVGETKTYAHLIGLSIYNLVISNAATWELHPKRRQLLEHRKTARRGVETSARPVISASRKCLQRPRGTKVFYNLQDCSVGTDFYPLDTHFIIPAAYPTSPFKYLEGGWYMERKSARLTLPCHQNRNSTVDNSVDGDILKEQ